MRLLKLLSLFLFFMSETYGQSANDILNVLVEQKTITQDKADSIRADYSIKQQTVLPDKKLRIDAEFRPRTEFRNGYQQLRNDTTTAAFFTNQRIRLSANYIYDNRFAMQFSIQDLRVWGQQLQSCMDLYKSDLQTSTTGTKFQIIFKNDKENYFNPIINPGLMPGVFEEACLCTG
ncbi:MAG: hypothetical protein NTY95_08345 [Bacteroidia bacterium]|nr:hypothetical protein [Bacteroidia bacterium]